MPDTNGNPAFSPVQQAVIEVARDWQRVAELSLQLGVKDESGKLLLKASTFRQELHKMNVKSQAIAQQTIDINAILNGKTQ